MTLKRKLAKTPMLSLDDRQILRQFKTILAKGTARQKKAARFVITRLYNRLPSKAKSLGFIVMLLRDATGNFS